MKLKHKIIIHVSECDGNHSELLQGARVTLPSRLLKFLFGDFQQIYLLNPGQTVASVDVSVTEN